MLPRPVRCADQRDLVAVLRRVAVHQQRMLPRQVRRRPRAARASTTRRSAARRPRAAARWPGRASAARAPGFRRSDACVRSSSRAGTAGSASIMHLPTTARSPVGSSASNTASVSCTVSIVRTRGGAAQQQFGGGERRGGRERSRRVRRLHRPDARAQPVEQRQVVGIAAEQRLAQMDVRLHEAGQQVVAAGVDDVGRERQARSTAPTETMRPSSIEHVAFDHVEGVVHREDGGVANEQRSGHGGYGRAGNPGLRHPAERRIGDVPGLAAPDGDRARPRC